MKNNSNSWLILDFRSWSLTQAPIATGKECSLQPWSYWPYWVWFCSQWSGWLLQKIWLQSVTRSLSMTFSQTTSREVYSMELGSQVRKSTLSQFKVGKLDRSTKRKTNCVKAWILNTLLMIILLHRELRYFHDFQWMTQHIFVNNSKTGFVLQLAFMD